MKEKIIGLPPIVDKETKILILGSMPSVLSLEHQEYYGNPRNHFWPIIYSMFGENPADSYEKKNQFIKQHRIGLWDTIGACYREGSLDQSIYGEEPNDIPSLLHTYSNIHLIACNGTKSFLTLKKYFSANALQGLPVMKLPSSSPIPGKYNKSLGEKIKVWGEMLDYL
ncbi:DNA-deoxyinosine glycosylase [Ornithinibacillus halotolerans]|uniref:DNA-deoxyinosine glycosylase n=1 Tax=Ornithinibacillus halotolerans TaxID=1274357 RepID=A0A916S5K3_9BACI|nr:DNA-deoxyinosine glycosylase [Ornithinibacillus halotolerans]GGA85551.1 DNA-deoxyinosine glycosylase [Ornithinibacillus halotolerans]